jgi:hypothetical protein
VSCENGPVAINQYRIRKSKRLDASGNLPNLFLAMSPRITPLGTQRFERQILNEQLTLSKHNLFLEMTI